MKHVYTLSKAPAVAQDIPISAKLTFLVSVLNAFSPLLVAKEGQT